MRKKRIKQTRKLFGQNKVHKLSEITKLQIEINQLNYLIALEQATWPS